MDARTNYQSFIGIGMNAFALPNFRIFFLLNSLSIMGKWVERLAIGWLAWQITESVFWTSIIALGVVWPSGVLSPFIAVYAENWDCRRTMLIVKSAMIATSVVVWGLQIFDAHTRETLLLLASLSGILSAFHHPTRLVFVSILVPRKFLPSAIGLNAVSWNMSLVLGPALAGLIIVNWGVVWAFFATIIMGMPLVIILLSLQLEKRLVLPVARQAFFAKMAAGLRAAWQSPIIMTALGMVLCNSLLVRALVDVQPAIIGDLFAGETRALALATASAGLGSLLAAIIAGFGNFSPRAYATAIRPALLGGLLASFGVSQFTTLEAVCVAFMGCGFFATSVGISAQTLIQLAISEEYRARVLTWWSSLAFSCTTLGGVIIGTIGDIATIAQAIIMLIMGGVVFLCVIIVRSRKVFLAINS
ncbi:MAG: MFS transporter [Pseudomonadota bacterium]